MLNFEYTKPGNNFDSSKIRGVAAKLFTVKDGQFCQGLTTAAGGKLYNVIVDDSDTGKILLDRGRLTRRTTFIPLDKINPRVLQERTISAAMRVSGKDNVWWAKDLVEYDSRLDAAMNFLLDSTLICRDLEPRARCVLAADPQAGKSAATPSENLLE